MKNKRTIGDILQVSFSNIFKLISGVLVGFLLPKIIGVTDYGYYKTFTLYATYLGLFAFGFIDGIYLKYGGKNYDELDKQSFRMFTMILFVTQFAISLILGVIFILSLSGELKFIFICLAVYLLASNITGYYQMISQITSRFRELSFRTIILSALTCLALVILWIINRYFNYEVSYRLFTIIYTSIMIALTFWYIWTYRDITFGKKDEIKNNKKLILSFIISGIPLLVSNLCQTLLITLDRQFVNVLFDTDTYAVYAFAYNMLALITTALSAISTVIYPSLKKTNTNLLKEGYSKFVSVILILVFMCLLVYFPLVWFINWFLPQYIDSLPIFRIILPGLAISSVVTIVMHNYYKTFNKEIVFFIKALIVLVLAIIANLVAYYLFKTTISISIASIFVMLVWYTVMELFFIRSFKVKWIKNYVYMLIMSSLFYLITMINYWWIGMLVYLAVLLIITMLFYIKEFIEFKNKLFISKKEN